jgi:type III pantothenate kinase
MILAAILGNTTLRHALMEGEEVVERGVVSIPEAGIPLPLVGEPRGGAPEAVVIGSVNPPRLGELLAALARPGRPALVAGRDFPIPIQNRYRNPAEAGADRLLNALGASRLWPGQGAVVIDFGTALSVSVVSPAGEFLGGPIAAGVAAASAGLSLRTAQLPRVSPRSRPRLLADSTEAALQAGIYWQIAAGAARILEELAAELPFPFHAVATGGDAALFAPAVPRIERVDQDLAFRGLAVAYRSRARR